MVGPKKRPRRQVVSIESLLGPLKKSLCEYVEDHRIGFRRKGLFAISFAELLNEFVS